MGTALASAPATVGFRLDPESRQILAQRAQNLGVSSHELARQYVFEALSVSEERAELHRAIIALQEGVLAKFSEFKGDLAFAVETLLVTCGEVDEEEAKEWIKKNFKQS